jgi:hypothetical protein
VGSGALSVHASVATRRGIATLRDIGEADPPRMAAYFHRSDPHLDTLIDRNKLPPLPQLERIFAAQARSGDPEQKFVSFAIDLDDVLVGFTVLARTTPEHNHSHWHIIDERLRGGGISSALYPQRIKMYFDLFAIERLTHQTKTSNVGVNRMLDKFVPVDHIERTDTPDGWASPGEFVIRYVWRRDVPRIVAMGEARA